MHQCTVCYLQSHTKKEFVWDLLSFFFFWYDKLGLAKKYFSGRKLESPVRRPNHHILFRPVTRCLGRWLWSHRLCGECSLWGSQSTDPSKRKYHSTEVLDHRRYTLCVVSHVTKEPLSHDLPRQYCLPIDSPSSPLVRSIPRCHIKSPLHLHALLSTLLTFCPQTKDRLQIWK